MITQGLTASKQAGRGAPPGNENAVRHGLRMTNLPKGCGWLEGALRSLRRDLIDEITQEQGPPTLYQDALIQSVVRHETRAQLLLRWLRTDAQSLTLERRLALLASVSNATDQRDKCLERLGLAKRSTDADAIAILYSREPEPHTAPEPHCDDPLASEPPAAAGAREATPPEPDRDGGPDA